MTNLKRKTKLLLNLNKIQKERLVYLILNLIANFFVLEHCNADNILLSVRKLINVPYQNTP